MASGIGVEEFWEMDFYEVLVSIKGYQSRIDDAMEVQALFTSALINSQREKKKIKPTDLFDRKKLEEKRSKKPETPEEALEKERKAHEMASRLPVPARLSRRTGPVPPPA